MSYELIKTINGPLIKWNDKYISPQEPHLLIEVAEADESFIPAFKAHVIENLQLSLNEVCEAFEANIPHVSQPLNAYLHSSFLFSNFVNGVWANYKKAKAEGGF
jgi:hypothetical protein